MVDFGELWREQARVRRKPDDAAAWDARARDAVSKYGPSGYSDEFLARAGLRPGETVLDMGCGAGALAVPCAQRGHAVLAADFSSEMLRRCAAAVPADAPGSVQTRLIAWDDDWAAAGLAPRSFDVAFASRSIATADMEAAIGKLSAVARRKVCVTLVSGKSPRVSAALFDDLGLACAGHQDAAFAFGIAAQMGFEPEVSFIRSQRVDRYASFEAALDAYAGMLRFSDLPPEQAAAPAARARVREWLQSHLKASVPESRAGNRRGAVREVESEGAFEVDVPRTFSWAFISWNV